MLFGIENLMSKNKLALIKLKFRTSIYKKKQKPNIKIIIPF